MQFEISLLASSDGSHAVRDLGYLLHKNPDRAFEREISVGDVTIFYSKTDETRCTAVLHLAVDPVSLVRGKNQSDGLLTQYVNDRPYAANSFLSVALTRCLGQSLAGKSKERQDLADRPLPFEVKVTPISASGGHELISALFDPLGYAVTARRLGASDESDLFEITLAGNVRLRDLLSHLYVLVPVLDNAKHYWIDRSEIDNLLDKGEGWLADHPAKELIARRALKHRPSLALLALARLADDAGDADDEADDQTAAPKLDPEQTLERPIRLHDLRLDTVVARLKERNAASVLDLGCGEGRLLQRLLKERGVSRIIGVDASVQSIERAARRLKLNSAGDALRERISLQMGSLTYADRRWQGFDAATLVEVIEHIDPPRLSALELSLFGHARPRLVIVTTPNREYNALFEKMAAGALRHPDHRFEWTREEFRKWAADVADRNQYRVAFEPLGPEDETHGAPSQMAIFEWSDAA